MFDLDHEFFKPLWIRIAVTAVALGWALVEFLTGAPFWGVLFLAVGLWCSWVFFVRPVVTGSTKPSESSGDPDA